MYLISMEENVYIQNYGCTANYNHGEIISGKLLENGFSLVNKPDYADIIIINSCIVKSVTENKIIYRLKELTEKFPGKKIIFTGCGADTESDIFRKLNKDMIIVSSHHITDIADAIRFNRSYYGIRCEDKLQKMKLRRNELINIVEISQGCLGNCTFCITRKARGKLISYSKEHIINDIKKSISEGCKEVWLTSQDCGCYGIDLGNDICNLLYNIIRIKGDFKVRLGMSNPQFIKLFPDRLSEILKNEKMFKFIHIPVQSGSDKILNLMKRGHDASDFINIVDIMRKNIPELTVSTDIIAGFPEEEEEDFLESMKILERTKPDIVNISKFGARPGTPAKDMKQIKSNIIKERTKRIGNLVKKLTRKRNNSWVERTCSIIIDEKGKKKNQWIGRNDSYKPVLISCEDDILGKQVRVKIKKAQDIYLEGEIIKE